MKQGWEWTFLRCCLASLWCSTTIYVAIPDYPYGVPFWRWVALDESGFLHEEFYIAVMFVSLITLTYFWQFLPRVLAHMPQIRSRRLRLE